MSQFRKSDLNRVLALVPVLELAQMGARLGICGTASPCFPVAPAHIVLKGKVFLPKRFHKSDVLAGDWQVGVGWCLRSR